MQDQYSDTVMAGLTSLDENEFLSPDWPPPPPALWQFSQITYSARQRTEHGSFMIYPETQILYVQGRSCHWGHQDPVFCNNSGTSGDLMMWIFKA